MILTTKKLLDFVGRDNTIHVRLAHWPSHMSIPLKDGEITQDGCVSELTDNKIWIIDTEAPMSPAMVKKVKGTIKPVDVLLLDGTPVQFTKQQGTGFIDKTTNTVYPNQLVYIDLPSVRNQIQVKKQRQSLYQDYIDSTPTEKLLTYGFELETQATEGMTYDQRKLIIPDVVEPDYHKMVIKQLLDTDNELSDSFQRLKKVGVPLDSSIFDTVDLKKLAGSLDPDDISPRMIFNRLTGIDIVKDGSTAGFEFRTQGGLVRSAFQQKVEDVMQYSHEIDHRCSFHLHIGSDKLKLSKHKAALGTMVSYILGHEDLPESVRTRLAHKESRYFCKFELSTTDKNQFIRVHPQGTLEFRCFGNITTVEDAMTCHRIATEAIKEGLKATEDMQELFEDSRWKELATSVVNSKKPSPALKFYQKHKKKIEEFEQRVQREREALLTSN